MPASPGRALRGAGSTITLADGTTVPLRYTFASLVAIEESFGDIVTLMTRVQGAADALEAQQALAEHRATDEQRALATDPDRPKLFATLVDALAPGLLDAEGTDPRTGEGVWLGERPDVLRRLLDFGQLAPYLEAFGAAFAESFAEVSDGGKAGKASPPAGAARGKAGSRGARGGTSSSAKAATTPRVSGA